MDKMKKIFLYILIIVVFFVFSNFLINVGINSTYKQIERKDDNLSQVVIYQAEATKVNGRVKGLITNDSENKISNKYLKIDFYSERDVNMGSKYIEINSEEEKIPIEFYFKLNNVSYYKMSLVDEKEEQGEIEFIPNDLNKQEIILGTIVAMLMIWG